MNLFVGNLSFEAAESDVKKLFEGFGNVASVVILKRKEKKAPKSRGFGFVDMPDEQQALAAIAGINGKEFMGRVIDVEPARPKVETKAESKPKKKREPERVRPFGQPEPGSYKGGRRSVSYMKRQGLAGVQQETNPRRRNQENPMRWRKRADQPKPWQKSPGERKPWEKAEGAARPWKKAEGEFKPWRKSEGGTKPWKKPAGDAKPWKKPTGEAKPWKKPAGDAKPWKKAEGEAKPWKKPAGDAKPWKKPTGEAKPWKKPTGEAKPWSKSSESPQKFRFKGRRKPGGYKR